jgi:hypothetical protein
MASDNVAVRTKKRAAPLIVPQCAPWPEVTRSKTVGQANICVEKLNRREPSGGLKR